MFIELHKTVSVCRYYNSLCQKANNRARAIEIWVQIELLQARPLFLFSLCHQYVLNVAEWVKGKIEYGNVSFEIELSLGKALIIFKVWISRVGMSIVRSRQRRTSQVKDPVQLTTQGSLSNTPVRSDRDHALSKVSPDAILVWSLLFAGNAHKKPPPTTCILQYLVMNMYSIPKKMKSPRSELIQGKSIGVDGEVKLATGTFQHWLIKCSKQMNFLSGWYDITISLISSSK